MNGNEAEPKWTGLPERVSLEAARIELGKILASPEFAHVERPSRFLRFVVEQTLEGHREDLKEYLIGVEVLGRHDSFDPKTDSIVRVEASRLRARLKQYYENSGKDDPILIDLPKGGYTPVFYKRNAPSTKLSGFSIRIFGKPGPARSRRAAISVLAAAALAILITGVVLRHVRPHGPTQELKWAPVTSDYGLSFQPTLSADGKLMAYASDRSGEGSLDIWLKQIGGGEPMRLTRHEIDDYEPSFSPDGTQIAYRSDRDGGGIYVIPTLGGAERLIAKRGRNPRFSPDGKWIAYWVGQTAWKRFGAEGGKLFLVASDGGLPQQIETDFAEAGSPVWSPDGKHILFYGTKDEITDWWVVPLEGGSAIRTAAFEVFRRQEVELSLPGLLPVPNDWIKDHIVFFARLHETTGLCQVAISPKNWQITGPVAHFSPGITLEMHPSADINGHLVFASLNERINICSLPLDPNRGKVIGDMQMLTQNADWNYQPSISADGQKLVFTTSGDVLMKDLETQNETVVAGTSVEEWAPAMAPDGSKVAYIHSKEQNPAVYLFTLREGISEKVCEGCLVHFWSTDGTRLTLSRTTGGDFTSMYLLDLPSRRTTKLVQNARHGLFEANFSPDDRWIAFVAVMDSSRAAIFVAPYQSEKVIKETDWIVVTDRSTWNDKPRWSPDGNLLYFVSSRDGFLCLWAQRLDRMTKRPQGPPFNVYHFHQTRNSLANQGVGLLSTSVARDKIVFSLEEITGNIWMTELNRE